MVRRFEVYDASVSDTQPAFDGEAATAEDAAIEWLEMRGADGSYSEYNPNGDRLMVVSDDGECTHLEIVAKVVSRYDFDVVQAGR